MVAAQFRAMDADEKAIIDYLKGCPGAFVSGKEIARKVAGKEQYENDRGWAIPLLVVLCRRGVIETDFLGHYRLKPESKKKKHREQQISPQILKILKSSGKTFDGVIEEVVEEKEAVAAPVIPVYRKPSPKPSDGDQPKLNPPGSPYPPPFKPPAR